MDLFIHIAAGIAGLVFLSGIAFRIFGGVSSAVASRTETDTTPFEVDSALIAYIRRNGGIKK